MRPKIFIASSKSYKNIAYDIQTLLDSDAECTVWDQDVFQLSEYPINSLVESISSCDFCIFILFPEDMIVVREISKKSVRDNVIFELGLSVGIVGMKRSFLIFPSDIGEMHLPTDLAGLTLCTFRSIRDDKNMLAALGPASNQLVRAIAKLGTRRQQIENTHVNTKQTPSSLHDDPDDCIAILQSWMGNRSVAANQRVIRFTDVDDELCLAPGSAKKYLEEVAQHWGYTIDRKGKETILFREAHISI